MGTTLNDQLNSITNRAWLGSIKLSEIFSVFTEKSQKHALNWVEYIFHFKPYKYEKTHLINNILVYPNIKSLLNKKIEMYEEMALS